MSELEAIETYMATTEQVGERLSEGGLDEDATPWQPIADAPSLEHEDRSSVFKPGVETPQATPGVVPEQMVFPPSDPRSLTLTTSQASEAPAAAVADPSTPPATAAIQSVLSSVGTQDIFGVRWISFQGLSRPVLCQNANGPCPLLAVCNILLLQQRLDLPPSSDHVTFEQLVQMLSVYLLDEDTSRLSAEEAANRSAAVTSLLDIFPKLLQGLDVNLQFSRTDAFEFTQELAVFDLFHIPLRHGWLVDPQETEVYSVLSDKSYNQAVCMIAEGRDGEDPGAALQAQQWLDNNRSQLSYHGLAELNAVMPEHGLNVFFRNNHFNVVYKEKNQLMLLVTDQAFATTAVVWETLDNVENDGQFLDAFFQPCGQDTPPNLAPTALSADAAFASQLQQAEFASANQHQPSPTQSAPVVDRPVEVRQGESDEALARRLQHEENQRAQAIAHGQRQPQQSQQGQRSHRQAQAQPNEPKKLGCIIS